MDTPRNYPLGRLLLALGIAIPCLAIEQAAPFIFPETPVWQGITSAMAVVGTAIVAVIGTVEAFIWSRVEERRDGPPQYNTVLVGFACAILLILTYNLILLAIGAAIGAAVGATVPLQGATPDLVNGMLLLLTVLAVFPTILLMLPVCWVLGRWVARHARHRALACCMAILIVLVIMAAIHLVAAFSGSGVLPTLASMGATWVDAAQGALLIGLVFFLALMVGAFWLPSNQMIAS